MIRIRTMMTRFAVVAFLGLVSTAALADAGDNLLPPDQAFHPTLNKDNDHAVIVHFDIADGYYLYRDRMHFTLEPGDVALKPTFPLGIVKHDDYFGDVMTYRHAVDVRLSAATTLTADSKVKVVTQGCADAGVCYPPQTSVLAFGASGLSAKIAAIFGGNAGAAPAAPTGAVVAQTGAQPPQPNRAPVAHAATPVSARPSVAATAAASLPMASGQQALTPNPDAGPFGQLSGVQLLIAMYLAGLGMAATVCMYPLIPIVSSIIVGDGRKGSTWRGFVLSLTYVQGFAVVYVAVGICAALSGSFLIRQLQTPWLISAMALLFVALAMSMFGLFTLQLPSALQSRLNDASNKLGGGRIVPVFLMGALSSLIVGACMGPPLAAALSVVAARGDVTLGVVGFYLMAMGVGTPLVAVGVLGGHLLPKAGPWMTAVNNTFGAVMLAIALWIAQPLLPAWAFMLGWAVLTIGCGVQLSALDSLPPHAKRAPRLAKAVGVLLLILGASQFVGLLSGARDPLQPLRLLPAAAAQSATAARAVDTLAFAPVASPAQLDSAIAAARGRPVMLDFYADWCKSCHEMDRETFGDARVQTALQRFVLLRADVTANTADQQALLKRFSLFGPPGTIFFGQGGHETGQRLVGFEPPEAFLQRLSHV